MKDEGGPEPRLISGGVQVLVGTRTLPQGGVGERRARAFVQRPEFLPWGFVQRPQGSGNMTLASPIGYGFAWPHCERRMRMAVGVDIRAYVR